MRSCHVTVKHTGRNFGKVKRRSDAYLFEVSIGVESNENNFFKHGIKISLHFPCTCLNIPRDNLCVCSTD